MQKKKIILIIGGHDPTGGAGITADIETANHFNCHPLSILTCTTIQDTAGVTKISNMPKDYIYKCFDKLINEFKVNVITSGGTYKYIKNSGFVCKEISEFTGFNEILDGRVKTLHPKIHSGILFDRSKKKHKHQIKNRNFKDT